MADDREAHYGPGYVGESTRHKGRREDCSGPDCHPEPETPYNQILEVLTRVCSHFQDDPECALTTAEALTNRVVTPELERLTEELAMHEAAAPATNELAKQQRLRAERAERELSTLKASVAAFEADLNRIIKAGDADHEQVKDELRRVYVERDTLKATTERVRAWHRPMHIYDGDAGCLGDSGCVHGEDYPIGEEGSNGGFCPHTSLAAIICFACSYQDTEGEGGMWPRWGWVLHENCATIARLDKPILPANA